MFGLVQLWHNGSGDSVIRITLSSFLYGEYAAATVLVSFCVVLGKVTILQLITMAVIEVSLVLIIFIIISIIFTTY